MFVGRLVIIFVLTRLVVDGRIQWIPISPHSGHLVGLCDPPTKLLGFERFRSLSDHLDIRSVLTRSDFPPGMLDVQVDSHPDIRTVLTRYAHYLPQRS